MERYGIYARNEAEESFILFLFYVPEALQGHEGARYPV
jgi:hypothetical protein